MFRKKRNEKKKKVYDLIKKTIYSDIKLSSEKIS